MATLISTAVRAIPGAAVSAAVAYKVYKSAEKQDLIQDLIEGGNSSNDPAAKILNGTIAAGYGGLVYTPFALHQKLTLDHNGMYPGQTWAQSSIAAWKRMFKYPIGAIEVGVVHVMPKTTIGTAAAGASAVATYELGKHFFNAPKPA